MSLFGSSTATTKPQLSLTFPTSSSTAASQPAQTGGLFGATSQPAQSGGLFGSSTSQPAQSGGLFGATTSQPAQSGGLFGATASQPAQNGGLFGTAASQPAQQSGGLFGASLPQPAQSGGLFGSTTQQQQPQQSGGLFGSTLDSTQQKPALGGSLFGSTTTQQPQQGGLFGASTAQAQPQQQQQQQPPQSGLSNSTLGQSTQHRSIWQPGSGLQPREKSIPEQIGTILEKWNPESPRCVFQHYFYNYVAPEMVPYYSPGPGEDEAKWEEALAKKPVPGSIPALARGFAQVAERITTANRAIQGLQTRMHEINNSLTLNLQKHELETTIRAGDARRRHLALSKRCLAIATKVQVLRNRGYAMDGAEEILRQKLQKLEKQALDPVLHGRQEEIWARLAELRDRAEMLREESDRLGRAAAKADGDAIDDETKKTINKLLTDYDSQLVHLGTELASIKEDFAAWQGEPSPARVEA